MDDVISKPFNSPNDIKLGMVVRDPSTNLRGQIDMKAELLSGTVQYAVQPQGDGKTVPERYYIDDFLLEYVNDGVSEKLPKIDDTDPYALGLRLKDTITGYVGIAIQRNTHLNGCVYYHLQRNLDAVKTKAIIEELPQGAAFIHTRLELVDKGVSKTADDGKPEQVKRAKTGGPTRLAPSRRVI